jgi:MFS family permease
MQGGGPAPGPFFGWRVVAGAFTVAVLGWGLGFYGPPVYLHAVSEARGWPVGLVSAAVTTHFLFGSLAVFNLPRLYARFGLPLVTRGGAVVLALGLMGWASAVEPWQLFAATALSGSGWATMGAAALNAFVSPWFVRQRPQALSMAYNGASIGGVIFSPLWVLLIGAFGFAAAAAAIGLVTVALIWWLTSTIFGKSPAALGQEPDGDRSEDAGTRPPRPADKALSLPGVLLWRNWQFQTLAAGMALGLFAQIGLVSHLVSLIVPALGATGAGIAMGCATACAMVGRMTFAWAMPAKADRRRAAALSYAIQILGMGILVLSGAQAPVLIIAGVLLFGFGIGNATSMPPLIAQVEFAREDNARVVALIVALAQAVYAFAPAFFGLVRELSRQPGGAVSAEAVPVFGAGIVIVALAIAALLAGRSRA